MLEFWQGLILHDILILYSAANSFILVLLSSVLWAKMSSKNDEIVVSVSFSSWIIWLSGSGSNKFL